MKTRLISPKPEAQRQTIPSSIAPHPATLISTSPIPDKATAAKMPTASRAIIAMITAISADFEAADPEPADLELATASCAHQLRNFFEVLDKPGNLAMPGLLVGGAQQR